MIRLDHISKTFGAFQALDDVSLDVRDGEFLALLGPSGSGKTTLLRIIAGLAFPDAGRVAFRGTDVTDLKVADRKVGFVFQHYALFKHMTIADNVGFGLSVRSRRSRPSKTAIRERARELLELVQLGELANRYPAQLSGGQRQRVALARALAVEPQLLLLDEPFGALDAKVRKELRRWLRQLHEKMGLTSIFVTHDQEEALELADRVVVMDRGRIEQVGTPEEVYIAPATPFVSAFVGDTNSLPVTICDGVVTYLDRPINLDASAGGNGRARLDFRPHDARIAVERPGSLPMVVSGVYRKGGEWRVEGRVMGLEQVIEVDIDADQPPPEIGHRLALDLGRARLFHGEEVSAMTVGQRRPAAEPAEDPLERIRRALDQMRYGAIGITVHDGRVVQIDITEKCRLTGN